MMRWIKSDTGPNDGDRQAVLAVIDAMLDTVTRRDKEGMRALLMPEGGAVRSRGHQLICTSLADLPDQMPGGTSTLVEIFLRPLVRIDDDIAMVWARYEFAVDGELHHWGTNIISLLKRDGRWRVSGVADNGRTGPRPDGWDDNAED